MTIRARELRAQGVDVILLTIGEPDFATPRARSRLRYQAALRGETKYPPQDGTRALKEAMQRKFRRDNGLDFAAGRDHRQQRRQAGHLQRVHRHV